MYPANSTQLDVDLVNPVMAQGQMSPQNFFSQRTDPVLFYSPNMMVNTSNSAQMMGSMNTNQYPLWMMYRPQVQRQDQMMRMPIIPNRMIPPLNMQAPQLGPISANRYSTPFQTYDNSHNTDNYNRLPNPGSSLVGQNLSAVEAIGNNVNRPFLPPYNTSLTPGPYQHMVPMMRNPFYPIGSDFSRYEEQSNSTASHSIRTVASTSVINSTTSSHPRQVCARCLGNFTHLYTHT